MRHARMPESRSIHPNVTPLIDVVMCLIIFYMLVAKIGITTGKVKEMTLPASLQGIQLTDMGNTVTLNILKPPGVNDPPVVMTINPRSGEMLNVPIEPTVIEGRKVSLREWLRHLRGQNAEFKVIIRADEDLDYRYIEPVLMTCTEIQPRNVNFATRQERSVTNITR